MELDLGQLILDFKIIIKYNMKKLIPDKIYLSRDYKKRVGRKLNLKNPKTFTEKQQWLKLYNRNKLYTDVVDKFEVRNYVSKKIGENYLCKLHGVYDNFEDIDFSLLPNKFVVKATHDSGSVYIVKDKNKMNKSKLKKEINFALKINYFYEGREWPYKNVKPRIIIEEYLENENGEPLRDYKIWCFSGDPKFIQVMSERSNSHFYINHFDLEWNEFKLEIEDRIANPKKIPRPKTLNEMIEVAKKLSNPFHFSRIDLYEINGEIVFGEITFFPAGGMYKFINYQDDLKLGKLINLDNIKIYTDC